MNCSWVFLLPRHNLCLALGTGQRVAVLPDDYGWKRENVRGEPGPNPQHPSLSPSSPQTWGGQLWSGASVSHWPPCSFTSSWGVEKPLHSRQTPPQQTAACSLPVTDPSSTAEANEEGAKSRAREKGVLTVFRPFFCAPPVACLPSLSLASLVAQLVRNPLAMRETWVQSLCWEDPLEKGTATLSRMLACGLKELDTTELLSLSLSFHPFPPLHIPGLFPPGPPSSTHYTHCHYSYSCLNHWFLPPTGPSTSSLLESVSFLPTITPPSQGPLLSPPGDLPSSTVPSSHQWPHQPTGALDPH